ncbi:MAG: CPBP family intramembrane metalloprotease [Chloroflexota bacterium]|nr:CPBP family intramembrane metalloprotease [Chloroflexota bacterium]
MARLLLLLAGVVLLVVGLVLNAVRSVVVRVALPPTRYRGPSIVVLVLLAVVISTVATLPFAGDALLLLGRGTGGSGTGGSGPGGSGASGQMSLLGSIVLLTSVQFGLLVVAAGFVAGPHALAGLRLVPRRRTLRAIMIGVGLGIPAWFGGTLLTIIATLLLRLVGIQPMPQTAEQAIGVIDPVVIGITFVLVAPIAEEIFFRGIAFNAWEREYGARRALIGSALLFALVHASLVAFLPIFGLGLVLALVYRRTRNLAAPIALHATFNAIAVALALLARFGVFRLPT